MIRACSAPGCASTKVRPKGHSHYCDKHLRFGQMIDTARRHKKLVPSREILEALVPDDMACPHCKKAMHWRLEGGSVHPDLITLQHWRSNAISYLCFSCNAAHGGMSSDEVFLSTPAGQKWCPRCETCKPLDLFSVRKRRGRSEPRSECSDCGATAWKQWLETKDQNFNRDRVRKYREAA